MASSSSIKWTDTTERCNLPDCALAVKARGMCSRHYQRWLTHGDPLVTRTCRAEPGTFTELGQRSSVTEWRRRNRDRVRAGTRSANARIKLACFTLFGGVCQRCGFDDIRALQIDHVNGARCARTDWYRAGLGLYRQLLRGGLDLREFQLLCANCNWIKRSEEGECKRADVPVAISL